MSTILPEKLSADILGDPHLGRVFQTGVPLHRLGDREKSQFQTFTTSLNNPQTNTHICLGDLFDKFRVSNEVVLATATAYESAALGNPDTTYIVLQGNHDSSKDNEKVSSFAIFQRMVSHVPNIFVLTGTPMLHKGFLCIPWTPFETAADVVEKYHENNPDAEVKAVFAHWDIDNYGNDEASHVLPVEELLKITNTVVLGHFHKPAELVRKGLRVVCWGSMEPFAHGEDASNTFYVTLPLVEAEEMLADNPQIFKDRYLRVLLENDESPLAGIECLALTHKRKDISANIAEEVNVDEFSLHSVFMATFEEMGIDKEITAEVFSKI